MSAIRSSDPVASGADHRGVGRLIGLARSHPVLSTLVALVILSIILALVLIFVDEERVYASVLVVASFVALPLAVWRTLIGEQQRDAQQEQAGAAQAQADNARLTRLNDQFAAAAVMMGHDAVSVRRLGIQSLQELAIVEPGEYYVKVLRSLCDYAREPFQKPGEEPTILGPHGRLRSDIQGAVQAIGKIWADKEAKERGLIKERSYVPNLIDADLRKGRFWSLDLSKAHLKGVKCMQTVFGDVNFEGADLRRMDISGADFTGKQIDARESTEPCYGFIQSQLDEACANDAEPPDLDGVMVKVKIKDEADKFLEAVWNNNSCLK